jgi:hypothetical protein
MPAEIRLDIADLPFSLSWGEGLAPVVLPAAYRPFQSDAAGGMPVVLSASETAGEAGDTVFDNAPIWTLHRQADGCRFRIFDTYPDLRRSLFLPAALDRADLTFLASDRDPFVGPTMELITILRLARAAGVILHGCGIDLGGRGIAFVGESGAGKSTLSRLWAEDDGARILSDDRVIVRRQAHGFRLYGSPWHGDAHFAASGGVPLERIYFLHHGGENRFRALPADASVRELLRCSFPPFWDPDGIGTALELLAELVGAVPCAEMQFVPEPAVVELLRRRA